MTSVKASLEGLSLIRQAIAQKGWRVRDDRWLVAASYRLEPDGNWRPDGPYAYGCSLQTWERFLQRVAIRDRSFIAFCQILNLSPNQVAESTISARGLLSEQETALLRQSDLPSLQSLLKRIESLEQRMNHLEAYARRNDKEEDCSCSQIAPLVIPSHRINFRT